MKKGDLNLLSLKKLTISYLSKDVFGGHQAVDEDVAPFSTNVFAPDCISQLQCPTLGNCPETAFCPTLPVDCKTIDPVDTVPTG